MNTITFDARASAPGLEYERPLRVAILGSGNIGSDLLAKVRRSPVLECVLFVGRNPNSPGLDRARAEGTHVSHEGIVAVERHAEDWDVLFDATSAHDHYVHWSTVEPIGKTVIDLTPAAIGALCIPAVNLDTCRNSQNVNMVTCGGQASIPLATALLAGQQVAECVRVESTIAASSVGPATLANIDHYVATTQFALQEATRSVSAAAILTLDSSTPPVAMQTSVSIEMNAPDLELARANAHRMVEKVQRYVPGYRMLSEPSPTADGMTATVEVTGCGDFLPAYAGNLDIITCAAITVAEDRATALAPLS